MNLLQFQNFEFPMKLKDIDKFEKVNNLSVNLNGFSEDGEEKNTMFPWPVSNSLAQVPKEGHVMYYC